MQKIILKITSVAALFILMSACSQKSTEAGSMQRQARPEAPQGQRGGGTPQFSELLAKMDANKDGKLAKAEVEGPLKNDFSKIDQDNDGFISETEFKKSPPPQRQRGGQ